MSQFFSLKPINTGRGFTLVELLVALSITSSIVLLIFAGMGSIGRSEQRTFQSLDRTGRVLSVQRWLQSKFDTMRLLKKQQDGTQVLFFNGNPAGALWIAPLPERESVGGLHVLRLTPERYPNGAVDWILEALPFEGSTAPLDWSRAERAILLKDVRTLQWYFQNGATGIWSQEWSSAQMTYPSRIRIQVGDSKGNWPAMSFVLPRAR